MIKRILSVLLVAALIFSISATSFTASALVDTTIIYGDCDANGKVDLLDAKAVLRAAALLESIKDEAARMRCDINRDGEITIYDARQILRSYANLSDIQPTGAFEGFNGEVFGAAEDAVNYFNTGLNKIKIDLPGFSRNEEVAVKNLDIQKVYMGETDFGESATSVTAMIKEMLVTESEPEHKMDSIKGDNCDNAMSVETESYVSRLNPDEVLGVQCRLFTVENEGEFLEIKIALPDCELDNVSQTAIGDVLSAQILQENMDTVVGNVFGGSTGGDGVKKSIKNCVLTAVFDTSDGSVKSYTTAYTTETYIAQSYLGLKGGLLSVDVRDVYYETEIAVTYDNFQW